MLPATTKQRILITGATGAIGQIVARALARRGFHVVLHCHLAHDKAKALKKQVRSSGAKTRIIAADLSQSGEPERLVAESIGWMGGLDLLVHCAATFEKTPFGTVTEEQWNRIIDANLKAAFFLAQAAGLAMKEDGGKMIFLSDVAATKPYGGYLPYCIAKAGVDSLVRGLARSLAPKMQVNAVAPFIVTRHEGMTDKGWNDLLNKTPMRRPSTPEEVAAVVKMLAESGESITGQVIAVDGGRLLR